MAAVMMASSMNALMNSTNMLMSSLRSTYYRNRDDNRCHKCGYRNDIDAKYCTKCGTKL